LRLAADVANAANLQEFVARIENKTRNFVSARFDPAAASRFTRIADRSTPRRLPLTPTPALVQ
jgi:hypothetical protein